MFEKLFIAGLFLFAVTDAAVFALTNHYIGESFVNQVRSNWELAAWRNLHKLERPPHE